MITATADDSIVRNSGVSVRTDLPASSPIHRDDLYVAPSSIPGLQNELGLFTSEFIAAGDWVGFFTGTILSDEEYSAYPAAWQRKADRYSMTFHQTLFDHVVSPVSPDAGTVNPLQHPLSMANEPPRQPRMKANVFVDADGGLVEVNGVQYACLPIYAAEDVAASKELYLHYGLGYLGRKGKYSAGDPCARPKVNLKPDAVSLVKRVLLDGNRVDEVLLRCPVSDDGDDPSDADYYQVCVEQARRVMPRRGAHTR